MENNIVAKLRAFLASPMDSECAVVYLLCESRKLLETYWRGGPIHFALRLYINWGLHIDLDHRGTTIDFLEMVDAYIASVLAGTTDLALENRMLEEFVFLNTFRTEFRQFLRLYNLPTLICDDDKCWHEFMENYAGVIQDGSLSCQGDSVRLRNIKKVTFTKGKFAPPDAYLPFFLSWTIELKDEKVYSVDVSGTPLPDGQPSILSVIRLK